ncbi:hypothetical protein NMG60_11001881 [Bertholletia excelsa]
MDPDAWVVVPDHGFLQIYDDGGEKIFSRKYGADPEPILHSDYFICRSPTPRKTVNSPVDNPRSTHDQLPVPIQSKQIGAKSLDPQLGKESIEVPTELCVVPQMMTEKVKAPQTRGAAETDDDQVTVSQVSFKQMKEQPQFADTKRVDSLKFIGGETLLSHIDSSTFQFEDGSQPYEVETLMKGKKFADMKVEKEESEAKQEVAWEEKKDGDKNNNIWKKSLTGIGAICSFGMAAAATVCVIIFGSQQKNSPLHQQNHKLHFQIYSDDKRIKQVFHHATRLNEAIYTVRGVPLARAHCTYGRHHDSL